MATVIDGTDPIEVQQLLLIASDRLADYCGDSPPFDTGTVQICIDLRDLAEKVVTIKPDAPDFVDKEDNA